MTAPVIVSYGAGTNSTAMLIGLVERGERVDAIVFADTGGERPETYAYVEMFSAWLAERGYPAIETLRYRPVRVPDRTLEEECLRLGALPAVAFGMKSCSEKWKIRPQETWAKTWAPAIEAWARGQRVVKCIGYDADEPHRAGLSRGGDAALYVKRFPLLEWDWGRAECVDAILNAGLGQPGKSSCFFCPNMRDHEVIDLAATAPDLFARSVAIERAANASGKTTPRVVGLGREHTWSDIVDGARRQCRLDMPCGCYDGDDS